jgi:Flp pilus assembly protein TadD
VTTAEAAPSASRAGRFLALISRNRITSALAAALAAAGLYAALSGRVADDEALEKRLSLAEARIAENPSDLKALYESGQLKFLKGPSAYAAAAADFERAREGGLTEPKLFYYLGAVYQGLGLYDFAEDEYRRYLNNRPGDPETRLSLAKIAYLKGDYAAAESMYAELAAGRPRDPLVLENQALAAWKNESAWAGPLAALRALGDKAAGRADFVEGIISHGSGDHARAAELLARAAASQSAGADQAELWRLLADSRRRLKDDQGAMAALRELLRLQPGDAEASAALSRLEKAAASRKKKK